jgi:two-component system, OmpR family, alkaline phosphatase synthesis response regulator PhoP
VRARRILIVEDDPKTSASIEMYLRHEGYRTDVARTGDEGLARAKQHAPDLVILDLMLPGKNGLEVCSALRLARGGQQQSKMPIIMLTARSTEDDKLLGLESGADDYVTKPFSPRELVARVRAVLRRAGPAPEERLIAGDLSLDRETREVLVRGESVTLTAAEFRLLETLMRSPGRVFTRDELVEGGLDRTVDVHIKNLRRKLEIDRANPARIVTVFGTGYKFVP